MPLVTRRAEQGNIFANPTVPSDVTNGSMWIDTSTDSPSISTSNGTDYNNIKVKLNGIDIPIGLLL